jgi:AcrR family transcriptional regulator
MALSREHLVDALLEMIDQGNDFGELNMRKLARQVGCAHTNIYNYFATWEELKWFTLARALEGLLEQLPKERAGEGAAHPAEPEDQESPVAIYIRYGLTYPERYRFVWLDPITGPPPPEVAEALTRPGRAFLRWLEASLRRDAPELVPQAHSIGRYLHAYMHGELAFGVAGRIRTQQPQSAAELTAQTATLYRTIVDQRRTDQGDRS